MPMKEKPMKENNEAGAPTLEPVETRLAAANEALRATRARRKRRRALMNDPVVRRWNLWNHDLDTMLHELVKNPALATVDPRAIVARAADFADALREMQDQRRPPGVPSDADEF
jgi:hypothetical protein